MKTPHDIYLESVAEFDEQFGELWSAYKIYGGKEKLPTNWAVVDRKPILHFIKSHTIRMLEADIERLEGEKTGQNVIFNQIARDKVKEAHGDNRYNQALQDQIDHYKSEIALIEES